MKWSEARKRIDKGEKMRRSCWIKGDYVVKKNDTTFQGHPLTMHDRLATDWEKYNEAG